MKMKMRYLMIPALALTTLTACGEGDHGHPHPHTDKEAQGGHGHDEASLGKFKAGDMEIEASQGHGKVAAGKEGHLVIKLPYQDKGATVVRAWIGTDDRTLSSVGKGGYTASKDKYDIHAVAPSPLPADVKWWVEIEKPDGTKVIGSVAPKL
ncbi:MAG: hypothetical protein RLZZ505_2090 [Verrucomicrobiota bacterium]|jgi:predicted small lipoprotein YifL